MNSNLTRRALPATALALTLGTALAAPASAHGQEHHSQDDQVVGHVYAPTNASTGNAVQVFDRHADGRLAAAGVVPTGGRGSGGSLHSQGGITRDGDLLLVVNAGDNSVSSLAITERGLTWRGRVASGGALPVSVTAHDGVGYVVNQGDDTITGFRYSDGGRLSALAGSTRHLTPNPAGGTTDAAQISFTPDGSALLVTEKASNRLETFAVRGGYAQPGVAHTSAGTTPYGFDFDKRGHAVVSEATTGSVSTYRVGRRGLDVISAAVPDTQAAACWLVVTRRGIAYVANSASGNISSYTVAKDGSLTLLKVVAANTGAGDTDEALSSDGRSLDVRLPGGVISSWAVAPDGSLTSRGTAQGAPATGVAGLVAS